MLSSRAGNDRSYGSEVQRYERLLRSGAISAETLDVRKIKLLTVQQELRKAKAELQRQRIKLPDGELVAPFSGTVLEIFARPGERPGSDGVLSIGRSDQMEAVLGTRGDRGVRCYVLH